MVGFSAVVSASAGFAGGFGKALVNGSGFSSALGAGLKGGIMGALGGGLVGGTISGFDAMGDGRNFWIGAGESRHEILLSGVGNGNQYSSNEEMWADYNANIGSRDGISLSQVEAKLNTNVSLADGSLKGYSINNDGLLVNSRGGTAGGVTADAWSGGVRNRLVSSRIVISPGLKGFELTARNMVFKHEFMHAWHRTFMGPSAYNTFSERAASTYSYVYAFLKNLDYAVPLGHVELKNKEGIVILISSLKIDKLELQWRKNEGSAYAGKGFIHAVRVVLEKATMQITCIVF